MARFVAGNKVLQERGLADLFKIQMRVIWALIIREMHTRYGRENIGFLWFIGEPILFCGGVTIAWSAIRPSHEHGLAVPAFVVTGYVPLTMWRHCVGRAVKAFESNGALLFHRRISPLDIIVSRSILEIFGTIGAALIVMTGTIILGYMNPPVDYGLFYLGMVYHMVFCLSCGLIIAALSERSEVVEKALSIVMYLSIPLSGAFTMVSWLPERFQRVILWSPSVQNLEMIRGGQFGPDSHPVYQLGYDTTVTAMMLLLGVSLTLRVRKHLVIQ